MRCAALLLGGVACGRVSFDPRSDATSDPASDTATDAFTDGFDFPGFASCPAGLTYQGSAQCNAGGYLEVTPATSDVQGAVWFTMPFALTPDIQFSSELRLQFVPSGPAGDGAAWVMQNDPRGPNALGGPGDGFGAAEIAPSMRVELDTYQNAWDIDGNHLAIQYDYEYMTPVIDTPAAFDMADGNPFTLWVDYDGTRDVLDVYIAPDTKPAAPAMTWTDDLTRFGGQAWFGFAAATGTVLSSHRILAWRVRLTP